MSWIYWTTVIQGPVSYPDRHEKTIKETERRVQ